MTDKDLRAMASKVLSKDGMSIKVHKYSFVELREILEAQLTKHLELVDDYERVVDLFRPLEEREGVTLK